MSGDSRPLVSVVLSFRNEAENIPALIARLATMFAGQSVDYEIVYVNDDSTDNSLAILMKERERNPRVKIVNMSRRFGVAEGVLAGMRVARGDAVVYMDADLQDPPEVIPALLDKWRSGAEVVHTVRTQRRGEHPLKMLATRWAYRVIQLGSAIELPVNAGDFKLLSRAAVAHLLQIRESDPYLRGLVVWLGFTQAFVPYERDARHAGRTHFPFFSKNPWKTFCIGMTSFSFLPIYACWALAAAGLVGSFLLLLTSGPLVALLAFFWATTLAAVGGIGIYVIRIYKDVRGRPPFIVKSIIGNEDDTRPGPR
jgi:glycosyltransferase involved in cell wall biosynthesis